MQTPGRDHASHDRLLVAAHAAGDAAGADRAAADALLAACAACAELHRDLRALAAALPAAAVPPRTRDFRLTPEMAAAARRRGLRGLLARLAAPSFAPLAPLGSAVAALGLAVAVLAGSPVAAPERTGTAAPATIGEDAGGGAEIAPLASAPDVMGPVEGAATQVPAAGTAAERNGLAADGLAAADPALPQRLAGLLLAAAGLLLAGLRLGARRLA